MVSHLNRGRLTCIEQALKLPWSAFAGSTHGQGQCLAIGRQTWQMLAHATVRLHVAWEYAIAHLQIAGSFR